MTNKWETSAKVGLALVLVIILVGCSWVAPKGPLFRKLVSAVADDYMGHELLDAGQAFPVEAAVNTLVSEGFFKNFAVLPNVEHQFCGKLQVPIVGTARSPEGYDAYLLNRYSDLFSPGYSIALYVDEACQVIRATGWKVRPNTL